ncbi:MAG: FHA domain-containing protein [Dehalococcoidia bacterium]
MSERTTADAYRTLHLLPSAPRQLVGEVYRRLVEQPDGDVPALEQLDAAYAEVLASNGAPPPEPEAASGLLPARQSPWGLLHLASGAPPAVVAVAYEYWRRDQAPVVEEPEVEREPDVVPDTEAADSADERLAALAATLSERRVSPRVAAPDEARLVHHGETRAVVGQRPLRVGTDEGCDVTIEGAAGLSIEARIWARDGRFMLHALGGGSAVLVNGEPAAWAVLEHGDRLQIGGETYRFERPRAESEAGGESH